MSTSTAASSSTPISSSLILRARYFNPLTGRFLTRDPANGQMTDPKSLHKYLYAGGDPIDMIDPTGRQDMIEYTLLIAKATTGAFCLGTATLSWRGPW